MSGGLSYVSTQGGAGQDMIDAIGRLRIEVFREYPYLYDGTLEYEREYLKTYIRSRNSLVTVVVDQDKPVGATTCIPLRDEGPEFQEPFRKAGWDVNDICYFGESIVLREYRGQGVGKDFFRIRETHAQKLGVRWTVFCAVDRAADHPLRPADYRPLDEFWKSRGYMKRPELQATFVWKEIGEPAESPKTLTFWTKEWTH